MSAVPANQCQRWRSPTTYEPGSYGAPSFSNYEIRRDGQIVGYSRPIRQVPWYDAQSPRVNAPQDLCRVETRRLLDRKREHLLRCFLLQTVKEVVLDLGKKEKSPC
jgi:hypothetical protein